MQGKEPLGSARTSRGAGRARNSWRPIWQVSPPARNAPRARRADRRGLRPRPPTDPRHLRRDDDPAARGLGRSGSGCRGWRSDCCDRPHELRRAASAGSFGRGHRRRGGRRRSNRARRLLDPIARGRLRRRRDPLGNRRPDHPSSRHPRCQQGRISHHPGSGQCLHAARPSLRIPVRCIRRASQTEFFTGVAGPRSSDYLFFSYTTLTTTGYGNLVPAGTVGQSFAVLEMLLGQFFLVTLVAGLVSLWRPGGTARAPVDGDR